MRKGISLLVLILLVLPSPSLAGSFGWITNFGQFTKDVNTLQDGAGELEVFMERYNSEIQQALSLRDSYMTSTNVFDHLRVGLQGAAMLDTKRGREMACKGLSLYQKYDPALNRVLDNIGSRDEAGEISDTQIYRAGKLAGVHAVFDHWKKHPFKSFINPLALINAYRTGKANTISGLQQYRELSKFIETNPAITNLIRICANYDDDLQDIPFTPIAPPRRQPNPFHPIDYLNKLDNSAGESENKRIRLDRSVDF